MVTETIEEVIVLVETDEPSDHHLVCACSPNVSRCGVDVTDHEWLDNDDNVCKSCSRLEYEICILCGE